MNLTSMSDMARRTRALMIFQRQITRSVHPPARLTSVKQNVVSTNARAGPGGYVAVQRTRRDDTRTHTDRIQNTI